ncbi:hypothetical protein BRADI_1g17506v3 [Brachypodium distachyon]|uniref:Uncharacterized protein n=1 Tax=Brachypodium distachyon TaxID=15368 RepID=A0A2K2DJU8_BRADI|nr:hypothetical protein BRADI_1g17506v3 [Brachypodium distachyon]
MEPVIQKKELWSQGMQKSNEARSHLLPETESVRGYNLSALIRMFSVLSNQSMTREPYVRRRSSYIMYARRCRKSLYTATSS